MQKPPIGVQPSRVAIPNRIKDLSDSISRYTEHEFICSDNNVSEKIKEWATEIVCHCDTIQKLNNRS